MLIGEQELDGLEASLGGRLEAVQKRRLIEHEGEIGGKARHGVPRAISLYRSVSSCALRRDRSTARCSRPHSRGGRTSRSDVAKRFPCRAALCPDRAGGPAFLPLPAWPCRGRSSASPDRLQCS